MEELGAGAPRGREPGGGGGKDGAKEGRTNGPSEGGGFGFIYSRGSLFIFYFLWGFGELSPSFSRCVQARRPMAGLGAGAEALGPAAPLPPGETRRPGAGVRPGAPPPGGGQGRAKGREGRSCPRPQMAPALQGPPMPCGGWCPPLLDGRAASGRWSHGPREPLSSGPRGPFPLGSSLE